MLSLFKMPIAPRRKKRSFNIGTEESHSPSQQKTSPTSASFVAIKALYDLLCVTLLPILFIVKGKSGGDIERDELPVYPGYEQGHRFCVQAQGWMDDRVWQIYRNEILKPDIDRHLLFMNTIYGRRCT